MTKSSFNTQSLNLRYSKQRQMKSNTQAGVTLIELMIALLLGVIMVGMILIVNQSGRATYIDVARMATVQENIRFASDFLVRDLRNAGFRDETFLKIGHETQIAQAYATVSGTGDGVLTIRYAGRGHCTQDFTEFRLVENEYSLNATTGDLECRGRHVAQDADGALQISAQTWSSPVGLVGGLSDVAFQLICPDGGTTCSCNITSDVTAGCIGVRIGLEFEALTGIANATLQQRSIELTAAFRNIILERVNNAALTTSGS